MNLFFWKNNKAIDKFASRIADELFSQVPPEKIEGLLQAVASHKKASSNKEKKSTQKKINILVELIESVKVFYVETKLGIYGKARLQMQFNERLEELGYSKPSIQELNKLILIEASRV